MDDSGQAIDDRRETTVSLPDESIALATTDFVTYRRSFNRPTGLNDGDSVALQSGLLPIACAIRFNGDAVEIPSESSIEIGDRLLPHNELVVTIAADQFLAATLATASLLITHSF